MNRELIRFRLTMAAYSTIGLLGVYYGDRPIACAIASVIVMFTYFADKYGA